MLLSFIYNGISFEAYTQEDANKAGVPASVIAEAVNSAKWSEIRVMRDGLIRETDWVFFPDSPVSEDAKALVSEYRQELRDIPQKFQNPEDVVWPPKPSI
jgi:hypothetical protein